MTIINMHRGIFTYPINDYYKRAPWYLTYPINDYYKRAPWYFYISYKLLL